MKVGSQVLIVAHDAGGAEVLSSWIKHHPTHSYTYILAGPAKPIFQRKLGVTERSSEVDLSKLVAMHDVILTGTSGEADLERKAICEARLKNKFIVSYLDHWCEYRERFLQNNKFVLPNEIWVGDQYALDIAEKLFPGTPLKLVTNFYFEDFKQSVKQLAGKAEGKLLNILYNCEPIARYAAQKYGSEFYFKYTEFTALRYFFQFLEKTDYREEIGTIRLRLHPLEEKNKYDPIIASYLNCYHITQSDSTFIEDVAWADWMIGCSSMALVLGTFAGKKVFTCNPPDANVFKLPHKEICTLPLLRREISEN